MNRNSVRSSIFLLVIVFFASSVNGQLFQIEIADQDPAANNTIISTNRAETGNLVNRKITVTDGAVAQITMSHEVTEITQALGSHYNMSASSNKPEAKIVEESSKVAKALAIKKDNLIKQKKELSDLEENLSNAKRDQQPAVTIDPIKQEITNKKAKIAGVETNIAALAEQQEKLDLGTTATEQMSAQQQAGAVNFNYKTLASGIYLKPTSDENGKVKLEYSIIDRQQNSIASTIILPVDSWYNLASTENSATNNTTISTHRNNVANKSLWVRINIIP